MKEGRTISKPLTSLPKQDRRPTTSLGHRHCSTSLRERSALSPHHILTRTEECGFGRGLISGSPPGPVAGSAPQVRRSARPLTSHQMTESQRARQTDDWKERIGVLRLRKCAPQTFHVSGQLASPLVAWFRILTLGITLGLSIRSRHASCSSSRRSGIFSEIRYRSGTEKIPDLPYVSSSASSPSYDFNT